MTKKIFLSAMALVLAFTLTGCKKVGTVDWVDWNPVHKGDPKGTCRVGVKNTIDQDGNDLGDTRFSKRGVTKKWCYDTYREGKEVTYGS